MRSRSRSAQRRDLDSLRCEPRWAKSGLSKEHTAGPGLSVPSTSPHANSRQGSPDPALLPLSGPLSYFLIRS
jgi:hypothetical protein